MTASKLLSTAACEVLGPLGATQMGRSRTWLDDNRWWLGVIEFQPSSWGRGSYLNVGVDWLWTPKDYLSFDFGGRVDVPGGGEFLEYESEEQFAPLARKLAGAAAEQMLHYRELFPTIEATAATLRKRDPEQSLLESLDTGIALGLVGDDKGARRMFARSIDYFESGEESEWRTDNDQALYDRVRSLSEVVHDRARFRRRIRDDVKQARTQLKLDPDIELPFSPR